MDVVLSRSGRSPPATSREAELPTSWVIPTRSHVFTKRDEFVEVEKLHADKEEMREKLLSQQAAANAYRIQERARQNEEWTIRQNTRKAKEDFERAFRANERKLLNREWRESVALASESVKARIHRSPGETVVSSFRAKQESTATETNLRLKSLMHFPGGNVKGAQEGDYPVGA